MAVNQLERNLESITRTISYLKSKGYKDENKIKELEEERKQMLKSLNIN